MYLNCTEHDINIYRREDVTFLEGSTYLLKNENIKPCEVYKPCGAIIRNIKEKIPCFLIQKDVCNFKDITNSKLIVSRRVADIIKNMGMKPVVPKQIVKNHNNKVVGCLKLFDIKKGE